MCFNDLHTLAEHFEDPFAPQQPLPPMTAPLPTPAGQQMSSYYYLDATAVSAPPDWQPRQVQTRQQTQFVACQGLHQDDMELNVDQSASSAPSSGAPSPPDASTSTSPLSYPSTTPFVATYSVAPSPHASEPASPASLFDTTTVLPVPWHGPHRHSHHDPSHYPCCPARPDTTRVVPEDTFMLEDTFIPGDAVNAYTGYANHFGILPNTATNASLFTQRGVALTPVTGSQSNGHNNGSVAPTALLLSRTTSKTPNSTPPSSPIDSSISGGPCASACEQNSCVGSPSGGVDLSSNAQTLLGSTLGAQTARASATLSRSPFSPLLLNPFKCPKPNCNKSYKQANGLKYHMAYGSCDSAPSEHFEHLMDVLASRPSVTAATMGGESEVTLSDVELREVRKEAERRLRPYACGVGSCQKRYKNLNGLIYHFRHSGDHGAIGLSLLASGERGKLGDATPSQSTSESVPDTPESYSQTHSGAASRHSLLLSHQQPQNVPEQAWQPPTYESAIANPPAYSYQHQPRTYPPALQQHATHAQQHYMPQTQQKP